MAFDELLPHTATVYRRDGTSDRFGQAYEAWDPAHRTELGSFPCRLSTARKGGQTFEDGDSKWALDVVHRLFAEAYVVCREDDLLTIKNDDGTTLIALARVRLRKDVYDASEPHHVEFELEVRRGPSSGV